MARKVNRVNEEVNVKEAIIVVLVISLIVLVMYGLTIGAQKLGWFNQGYVKPEVSSAVISYEKILAGTIFNRVEEEYYVLVADFDSEDSVYVSSLASLYNKKEGDKLHMYAVNLGEGMNKGILSDTSNPSAQNVESLKVNGPTLFKIRNGSNVRCLEGNENIKTELGV